jgi:hypothetical protein
VGSLGLNHTRKHAQGADWHGTESVKAAFAWKTKLHIHTNKISSFYVINAPLVYKRIDPDIRYTIIPLWVTWVSYRVNFIHNSWQWSFTIHWHRQSPVSIIIAYSRSIGSAIDGNSVTVLQWFGRLEYAHYCGQQILRWWPPQYARPSPAPQPYEIAVLLGNFSDQSVRRVVATLTAGVSALNRTRLRSDRYLSFRHTSLAFKLWYGAPLARERQSGGKRKI